jgi:hypothetical protein
MELQVITALSLISTLYKWPQHPLSLFQPVLTSRSLTTASKSGDSAASRAQVLLSQPPVQNSCQLDYSAISTQPPLQSSTELVAPILFFIATLHGLHRKRNFFIVACVFVSVGLCLRDVAHKRLFIRLLHSNSCTCLYAKIQRTTVLCCGKLHNLMSRLVRMLRRWCKPIPSTLTVTCRDVLTLLTS